MRVTCIADLHGYYPKLEGGDLLIVAGDLTASDKLQQYQSFFEWFCTQNYEKKIFISGNHDNQSMSQFEWGDERMEYLLQSGTEYKGLKIWGSPYTPSFKGVNSHCMAFMCDDYTLHDKWVDIPHDTDILITHGPAYGMLDGIDMEDGSLYHAGSHSLASWLTYVERPKYHIFGHIHEGYGQAEFLFTHSNKMMQSINCSHVDGNYKPVNPPINFEI